MAVAQSPKGAVIAMVTMASVLIFGFMFVGMLADMSGGITDDVTRDAIELNGAGNVVAINDADGTNPTAYKTTGYAVNLSGANDSYVESSSSINIASDQNWTVSLWGYVDQSAATDNRTALSLDGRVLVWYNGTAGNWSAWYYDDGGRNSYQVNVSDGGDQPGNYTNIIVRANGSELSIYRNNTLGDTVNITNSSIVDAPVNNTNWNGRLEEIRTFDEPLNSSKRAELVNQPVNGTPGLNRTGRMMFDQPNRSKQIILFASATLTQSNVSFSGGFAEQIMTEKNKSVSGDYNWSTEGPTIEPTTNGLLADAPVVYIDYTFEELQHDTVKMIGDAFVMGGVVILLVAFSMFLQIFRKF